MHPHFHSRRTRLVVFFVIGVKAAWTGRFPWKLLRAGKGITAADVFVGGRPLALWLP